MRVRHALARYQATFGASTTNAQPFARGIFSLWGEPPQLRIQIQTWQALLATLQAQAASLEDVLRYIARPGCPAGFVLAQHHLRRQLALLEGAASVGMDRHAFKDLAAQAGSMAPQVSVAGAMLPVLLCGVKLHAMAVCAIVAHGSCDDSVCHTIQTPCRLVPLPWAPVCSA